MEVWTMQFFKQQCSNKQRQEEQGEQTPKGTREIYLYSCGCVNLSVYVISVCVILFEFDPAHS